jgi:sugar lactone lactonase YvrE
MLPPGMERATGVGLWRSARALLLWLPVVVAIGALVGATPRSVAPLYLSETSYGPWASVPSANVDEKGTIDGDVVHTPNDRLEAVSCASGQCTAVGGALSVVKGFDAVVPVAERSTGGGEWKLMSAPNPAREAGGELSGVSCVSASLCMAIGTQEGGLFGEEGEALGEYWDGTDWTATPMPNPSRSRLLGVSCPDTATCYTVGEQSGGNGALIEKASLQGPYVKPAAGTVVGGEQLASANNVYTASWDTNAGTVTVTEHTDSGTQTLFTTAGTIGGFSPDSESFVTATLDGGVEHVQLYNLAAWAAPIYTASATVTSSSLVFSPGGHYLLFGYTTPSQTFLEVANAHASDTKTANVFTTGGIDAASAPDPGSGKVGSVTYGFGPGDSRFLYGYVATGAQSVDWHWTDLSEDAPQQINSFTMSATSGYARFSPSGKFVAFVNGDGTGAARVDLFDSTTGAAAGAAGPANAGGSPPDLEAGTDGQTATIGSSTYTMTPQTDFSWSVVAAPQPSNVTPPTGITAGPFDYEGLFAISCVAANDCTAVGEYDFDGTDTSTGQRDIYGGPLVVHWDGTSWKVVYDPDTGKVTTLSGTAGISCVADDSTATGDACVVSAYAASSLGVIQLKSTGGWTAWKQVTGPKLASRINYYLPGVSCTSPTDCTAVGFSGHGQGSGGNQNSMAAHYDGTQWSFETVPGLDGDHLNGVDCPAAGTCTAVGSTYGGANVQGRLDTDPAALVVEQGQAATASVTASSDDVAWGSNVTYSLVLGGPATPASGTVFFAGGGQCSAQLVEGHASCRAFANSPGTGPVEAYLVFYSGSGDDQNLSGSWRGPTVTVEPPPTTTAASVSPGSGTVGDTVTYSAQLSSIGGVVDDGSVTFSIGSLSLCTASVGSDHASCTSTAAPIGTDTVKAAYSGAWDFKKSSGTTELAVAAAAGAAATSTAVTATPAETTAGQSVAYSATVSAASGAPTGTVLFSVGSTDLCTATLSGGTATCSSAAAPVGSDTVTGAYSGNPEYDASSGTAALTVDAATTTPRLVVANSGNDTLTTYAATFGGNSAPASVVSDDGSGSALNAPAAAVFDASGHLWVADCGSSSVSEYSASELAPSGSPTPLAKLTDDGNGSLACPDALAFDSTGNLWAADGDGGAIVEYTAAELADLATTPDPSPALSILDDGQGDLAAPSGLAFDPSGDLWVADPSGYVVDEFSPAQLTAGGRPTPAAQLYVQATSLAFDSSGGLWAGLSNAIDEFTAAQLAALPGSQPAPAVRIEGDGSGALQDANALGFDSRGNLWVASAGQSDSALVEYGSGQLSASGDPAPLDVIWGTTTGLSDPAGLAIEDASLADAAVTATPATVTKGDPVTYAATLTGSGATPGGTVTFTTGQVALCTATLAAGSGSCDSSAAPIGTDDVTAVYSGDRTYAGSVSDTSVVVQPPPAGVQASASPSPARAGQNVELTVSVTGPGGTPTGTVDFTYQGQELCSTGLDDGTGSCVAAAPPAGDDTITASYSGDPDFAASTGTAALTSEAPGPTAPSVVVADVGDSRLQSYPLTATGDALPTVTISDRGSNELNEPDAMTVDSSGNLWVATAGSGELLEYTADQLVGTGDPAPAVVISSPNLDIPSAIAFDSHGNLWETDSEDGDVVEFTQAQLATSGDVAASVVLTSSSFDELASLAFDGAGDLWILNRTDMVELTPDMLSQSGSVDPAAVISDDGSGDLFFGAGLTFDAGGDLWLAADNGLSEFTPAQLAAGGTPTPAVTVGDDGSSTLVAPRQLAFDAHGDLWVASQESAVLEYTAEQLTSSGDPTPSGVLRGPTTQLENPAGLAILGAAETPPPPVETLTVSHAGTGSGTVTSTPGGISCGATCSAPFAQGSSVTLTATPAAGSVFAGWSGACSGTGTCTVDMTSARTVTATFSAAPPPQQTLTVTRAGAGSGAVTSSPAGISCGATCSAAFAAGTSVTLTAAPASGSVFAGWSGACSGTGTCTVDMTSARSVTATFAPIPPPPPTPQRLTVTNSAVGGGSGTVTSSPAGISCGTTCSAAFAYGASVTLTATPSPGSAFSGWSGACTGTGNCTVAMTAAHTVTATFALRSPPPRPVECVVPKVTGKTLGAARKAIARAHCRAKVEHAYSNKVRKGIVVSQKPAPHATLRKGRKVTLVVSKGKRPRHK